MPDHTFFSSRNRRHRLQLVLAATLCVVAAGGCSDDDDDPTPPAGTGTIQGSVTAGGEGVPDADVALTGAATRATSTDADGDYAFANLPAGDYTATVTLPDGYALTDGQTAARNLSLTAGATQTVNWSAEADASVQVVRLQANAFSPATLTIDPGTTVRWVVDVGVHTVTPDDADQPGAWEGTGSLEPGDVFEHTFTESGETYPYHCTFHQATGMTGTVVVR